MEIFNDPKFSKLSKYYFYTLIITILCVCVFTSNVFFLVLYLVAVIASMTFFDKKLFKIYQNTVDLKEHNKLETEYLIAKDESQKCQKENEELKRILEEKVQKCEKENEELRRELKRIIEEKSKTDFILLGLNEIEQIRWTEAKVLIIFDDNANIPTNLLYDAEIIITKNGSILKNVFGPTGRIISNQD